MNNIELLAPAGNYEALMAAVQNGCDAVYLGGVRFGARALAHNFDDVQMQEAVSYAHTYGVRVYVTVNTLIKQDEMEECLLYCKQLQEMDVDALIIQDIGLFYRLHAYLPQMELHASTQMHIHNPAGIQLLKTMGATRFVVPRETTIEEIQSYQSYGVDIEVFVQGALCVSYSGQCLMSSLTLHRSGNRGACAQNCRMQYEVEKTQNGKTQVVKADGKYLLSLKDLNTIEQVPKLIEAGVSSLKIEGRMKRPEYVAVMVASYRKAIDAYMAGKTLHVDQDMMEGMKKIFNRGYTTGHIFHQRSNTLVNMYRPNHMGVVVGVVCGIHKDRISVRLQADISQGDGIRILASHSDEGFCVNRMYYKGKLVREGNAGDIIELDKTFFVEMGSQVVKTSDVKQLRQLKETYQQVHRHIALHATFYMKKGKQAILTLMDDDHHQVEVCSDMLCEQAKKTPLSQERVEAQLRKCGDTPCVLTQLHCTMDQDGTLPIKEINRMRRVGIQALIAKRTRRHDKRGVCPKREACTYTLRPLSSIIAIVYTQDQLAACQKAGVSMIFSENALDWKKQGIASCFMRTPRIMKAEDPHDFHMIQEAGGLYPSTPVLCDPSCNMTNVDTSEYFFSRQAQGVCFSLESSLSECEEIVHAYYERHQEWGNFVYPVYGREELMIMEYCVINAVEKSKCQKNCQLCRSASYALLDMKKRRYPLYGDRFCRMHIFNAQPRNRIAEVKVAKKNHITSFLCMFYDESKQECLQIFSALQKELSI